MAIADNKETIRRSLLAKLLSLTYQELERRSKDVEKIISSLSIYKSAKTIMVYYPLKGEVNLLGIAEKVLGEKEVCFPVIDCKNKCLVPYSVRDLKDSFIRGPYGVMQPDTTKAKEVAVRAIDLVFVPGIAFDRNKYRLGRGGGFYDRLIKRLHGHTKTVGVAFNFQILQDLPVHIPRDEKVDFIVTDIDCS